jgi:anaphase-promoting complex subunit 8
MVLAKDKNEEEAMRWLIQSVHRYPMNWGCWLEMTSLIGRVQDVSTVPPHSRHQLLSVI